MNLNAIVENFFIDTLKTIVLYGTLPVLGILFIQRGVKLWQSLKS